MADPQTHSDVPDGWEVVPPPAAPAASAGHDFKILGVNIHVPAEEKPRADSNILGWGSNGAGIAPEDALAGGLAARGVVSAAKAGGAVAGVKAAITQATPVLKYETTKALLEHMGVPAAIAIPTAMMISGYKRGASAAETGVARPAESAPAGVDRYMPNQSGYVPPATPAAGPLETAPAPAASAAPSVAPSAPAPRATAAPLDMTHEEWQAMQGLVSKGYPEAEVRQAIRARQAAAAAETTAPAVAAPPPAAPTTTGSAEAAPTFRGKPKFSAAETKEYLRLKTAGKSSAEAEALIEAQRLLQQRLGLPASEATRQSVAERNATGRWSEDR